MTAEKKPTAKVKSGVIKTPETKKAPAAPAKAAPEKKEAVKAAAAVKAEEKREAKEMTEKKTTAAKAPAAKTTTAKKPAAKKAAAPKKEELKAEVTLQFNGNDYTAERLIQSAKDVWQYDMGRDVADFKSVKIFVKPDDRKAYAVVNETEQLSFDI